MLHTNLSTRPFYNTRLVRIAVTAVAVLVAGLTVFNVVELWRLQRANTEQGRTVVQNETEARDLREKARTVQQSIDRSRLALVDAAAREANALIDRRAFSWTELFNQFQATLPPAVRILAVQPQVDDQGALLVSIRVVSRQQEDLDTFIEALEKSGVFRGVLSRSDTSVDEGLASVLQAYYDAPVAAIPPPPASEPGKDVPANRTAANIVAGGRP